MRRALNVPEGKPNAYGNDVIIPQYGIEKGLQAGDNINRIYPKRKRKVQYI